MVAPDTVPPRHSSAAAPQSHAIDRAVLQRLAVDVGEDTMRDMCRLYLRDLPGRVSAMSAAFSSGDGPAVARAAHGLAAGSRLIGAAFLAELCVDLERRARSGPLDDAAAPALGMVVAWASKTTEHLQGLLGTSPEA